MSCTRRAAGAVTGILLALACDENPFAPLYDACAQEMPTVRQTYVDTPDSEDRVTLADGRRAVVWGIAVQPGPGLTPRGVAFIWSSAAPASCAVCWPADPCWTDTILPALP
jgi:hypothetical protein